MSYLNLSPETAEALARLEAARSRLASAEAALSDARRKAILQASVYAEARDAVSPLSNQTASPEAASAYEAALSDKNRLEACCAEAFRADCAARMALQAASTPEALEAERTARREARRDPLKARLEAERAARREVRQALKPLKEKLEAERAARREARRERYEREAKLKAERYERESVTLGVLVDAAFEALASLRDRPVPEDPDALFEMVEALRRTIPILHKRLATE
jgi:colicin import membrane protein